MYRRNKKGPDADMLLANAIAAGDDAIPNFTYTLQPNSATVSTTASTMLTVTNPSTVFPVHVAAGTDMIIISGWSGITQSPKAISPVSPDPWGAAMTESSRGTVLKIFTIDDVDVLPQQTLTFTLNGILIDDKVGTANLSIAEIIGNFVTNPPALAFAKLGQTLQIFAWSDVNTVGAGQSTNINWTIMQGLFVTVIPPDDGTTFPRTGIGPYSGKTARTPFQNAPQTTFTATVFQPPDQIPFQVVVNLSPPRITRFDPQNLPPIAIDDIVTLSWSVAYSPQVTLLPSKGSKFVDNEGIRAVKPRDFLADNTSSVIFVLNAAGYNTPATKKLTVNFQPMRIAYFRYPNFDQKNGFQFSAPNALKSPVTQLGPTHFMLNAVGPGGPLTQELGGTGLEIQVLIADPPLPKAGQPTTLKYLVQAATSLVLQPGNIRLTFGPDGRGETTVTPSGTTTYMLIATGSNNQTVSSELTVQTTAGTRVRKPRRRK